jgi:hypothetical protein
METYIISYAHKILPLFGAEHKYNSICYYNSLRDDWLPVQDIAPSPPVMETNPLLCKTRKRQANGMFYKNG